MDRVVKASLDTTTRSLQMRNASRREDGSSAAARDLRGIHGSCVRTSVVTPDNGEPSGGTVWEFSPVASAALQPAIPIDPDACRRV